MKVTIEYAAQVKRAAGIAAETVEVDPACTLQELLKRAAERHGEPLRRLLFADNAAVNIARRADFQHDVALD